MSFTPERSNSGEIDAFAILQNTFSQVGEVFLPLIILSSPSVVVAVFQSIPALAVPVGLINGFFVGPVISGASCYFVYRYLSTQTSDLGNAVTKALEKLGQLIIAMILYVIAVMVGFICLIVPGIYVAVRLGYFFYGIMIDDLDAVSSLKKSWELVGGRWWSVFGAQFLAGACFFIPVFIAAFFIGFILGPKAGIVASLMGAIVGLVATPFLITYYTKLYLVLRGSDD